MKRGKNKTYLPTYAEAVEMTQGDTRRFYELKYNIDGYTISTFEYQIVQYADLISPFGDERDAMEMRGLTYVFNLDGSLYKCYRLLQKFFNLNQVEMTLYDKVKNYVIEDVELKQDGSIVTFIELPNGKIIPKSKMGIGNDISNISMEIYESDPDLNRFVKWAISNELVPVFEYISYRNLIVIKHECEKLVLLKLRDNKTGEYIRIDSLSPNITKGVEITENYDIKDLDKLIEKCEKDSGYEGFVIRAIDEEGFDFFFKIKTEWYRSLHGLMTEDIYSENRIIRHIIKGDIDDLISNIPPNLTEVRARIDNHEKAVNDYLSYYVNECHKLLDIYTNDFNDMKNFASEWRKNVFFHPVAWYINSSRKGVVVDFIDLAKEEVLRKTNKLWDARKWLEKRGSKWI